MTLRDLITAAYHRAVQRARQERAANDNTPP